MIMMTPLAASGGWSRLLPAGYALQCRYGWRELCGVGKSRGKTEEPQAAMASSSSSSSPLTPPPPLACTMSAVMGRRVKELAKLCKAQLAQGAASVRRPLRRLWRPLWLRFTYVTSVLVKKY
jgi:hypothetical protein